jgi:hypothetical protein
VLPHTRVLSAASVFDASYNLVVICLLAHVNRDSSVWIDVDFRGEAVACTQDGDDMVDGGGPQQTSSMVQILSSRLML